MIWNDATLSITLFDIGLNLFVITDIGYQKHSLMACALNQFKCSEPGILSQIWQ